MEQNDLLSLISQKHNDAFRYLYKNYYIALKAVANYYTKNEDISEDLVQDVFISLLDCKTRFSTINDLKYFLYAALKNKCLNHLRNQKVRNKYQEHLLSSPDETDNYWEHVLKEDVYASLYTAIQTLSPQCRQVMQLSLEGKK